LITSNNNYYYTKLFLNFITISCSSSSQDTIADEDKTPPPRPVLAKNPVLHRPGAAFSIPKNSSDLLVSQLVNETQSLLGSFNTPVAPAKKPPVLRDEIHQFD
jgi:hypothetical protein